MLFVRVHKAVLATESSRGCSNNAVQSVREELSAAALPLTKSEGTTAGHVTASVDVE